ncbi:MAG TPA: hypothetical protein IGS40_16370 [Trichormus sp. M33_DOE_039]|nr:hypothetical protein [Trichormus sp. M33_DOE_039]
MTLLALNAPEILAIEESSVTDDFAKDNTLAAFVHINQQPQAVVSELQQKNQLELIDKVVHLGSIESSTRQQWSEGDVRNRYTTTDF